MRNKHLTLTLLIFASAFSAQPAQAGQQLHSDFQSLVVLAGGKQTNSTGIYYLNRRCFIRGYRRYFHPKHGWIKKPIIKCYYRR